MSGIVGIVGHDRGGCGTAVQKMMSRIRHRGPDGAAICHIDDGKCLGHLQLDTGCNGMACEADGFCITMDGRLDNRAELSARFAIDPTLPDHRIILECYRRVAGDTPCHLVGDFAFAIWDPTREQLFCARDHFGTRPFFYALRDSGFAFASEAKALLAVPPSPATPVDRTALEAFVTGEGTMGPGDTIWCGIAKLPAAHTATVSANRVAISRYWRLTVEPPTPGDEVAERFRALLGQAVLRRLRGSRPVSALLSGGLDSSAIVSLAATAGFRLPVTSLVYDDAGEGNERPFIEALLRRYDLDWRALDASDLSTFAELDQFLAEQDHPVAAPNHAAFRQLLRRVATDFRGGIVLHGHGGDEVVSYGSGHLRQLAARHRWKALWQELGRSRPELSQPRYRIFAQAVWRSGIVRSWRKLRGQACAPIDEAADHIAVLCDPLQAYALEVIDHDAAAAGLELRMPFWDLDLVRFAVSLPAHEKWRDGFPRAVLRRALHDILPEEICWRRDKLDFSCHLKRNLGRYDRALVERTLYRQTALIEPYLDVARLRQIWARLQSGTDVANVDAMLLWRSVILSAWLKDVAPFGERATATDIAPSSIGKARAA